MEDFYRRFISEIKKREINTVKDAMLLRRELLREMKLKIFPSMMQILMHADNEEYEMLRFLITKPTRTLSGVTPVAVMTKPIPCPHGKCIFCPGGVDSSFGSVPQSYTGHEPSTMRGYRNDYDPYLIVFNRLEQYVLLNQNFSKVDLIIQGGTFPAFEKDYQEEFVKYCFKALNDFSDLFFVNGKFDFVKFKEFFILPRKVDDEASLVKKKLLEMKGECSLVDEQKKNEKSNVRCVGLTIETRPDYGLLEQGNEMLRLGCTRVELGVQSVHDSVLDFIERGHDVATTKKSFQILKDLGFKINAHYMLGLGKEDLDGLFTEEFRPDMLKIYPCMVMPGTKLEELYKKGKFKPITTEEAVKVISEFKKNVPKYCRIMRVQRDIPTKVIVDGIDKTNLRQEVEKYCKSNDIKCNCIRCREIGRNKVRGSPSIVVEEYDASNGKDFFISLEKDNVLFGFCRLRFVSESLRPEITLDSGIVRELHVLGSAVGLGEEGDVQHKGYGKMLIKKAEEICLENDKDKILVISGVGAKEYYRKIGYSDDGVYVSKLI